MEKLRVLYVDDEPDIREIATISLGLGDEFDVKACASGEEAVPLARTWKPDVILLDVMMPVVDGPETLRRLRLVEETNNIPIIFVTARTQKQDVDGYIALGALGVIAKPFMPLELIQQVKDTLVSAPR
ncbi:response regulator [Notoacmeibacter sp. MSK16QG-6]|uniref:response regulator n=1 Tax=Notoacmeibacter sp. MSK16QG-6 TaxID=2957982 RepID=UPI00209E4818|nr:response regulator [Notoacmeibacter sp. MSK16QG-6]MCP1198574.1 response regulator [Notoacmeibacter sp. MSK16QG-6]